MYKRFTDLQAIDYCAIDEYCRKYNCNSDELYDIIFTCMNRESEEWVDVNEDKHQWELEEAKSSAYDEGYADAEREASDLDQDKLNDAFNRGVTKGLKDQIDKEISNNYVRMDVYEKDINMLYIRGWRVGTSWLKPEISIQNDDAPTNYIKWKLENFSRDREWENDN